MADEDRNALIEIADAPRPERRATLRLGQRELGAISITVILVIVAALGLAGYRIFLGFKSTRDLVIADSNLHALYSAMQRYSEDWDDRLPSAPDWTDKVAGYLSAPPNTPGGAQSYLHGSGDSVAVGYVYNDLAAGYNLRPTGTNDRQRQIDPGQLVLLIERPDAPRNAHVAIPPQGSAQGEQALYHELAFPHFADDTKEATTVVLFANGSLRRYKRLDFTR